MIAKPTPSAVSLSPRAIPLALSLCLLLPCGAQAGQKNKKHQQRTRVISSSGSIEVSTQPGGYPITIDGRPAGETTDYVRAIELDPGRHTVEIEFPNKTRWSQVFNIIAGRINCIALSYRARTIEIPALPDTPAVESQHGPATTINLGDVTGTVCDCGGMEFIQTPISKVPWWKRAAGKLKPK